MGDALVEIRPSLTELTAGANHLLRGQGVSLILNT